MRPLEKLREEMRKRGIDIYMVPTSDFHLSEYVGDHFKEREFLTGFTGSAGTAVVTEDKALLWTDGRYFIQAERQIRESGFSLCKMGVEGVPTVEEFIASDLRENGVLGFDGRVIDTAQGERLASIVEKKNGSLRIEEDLVGLFFTDRPALSCEPAWVLGDEYAGESVGSKLKRIRERMKEEGANVHFMGELSDIAWTLNLRGNDAKHFPIVLSYLFITESETVFFVQEDALTDAVRKHLTDNNVRIESYGTIFDFEKTVRLTREDTVLIDKRSVNYRMGLLLSEKANVKDGANPAYRFKAVKNEVEIRNIKKAHVEDGVAMVKFLFWLRNAPMDGSVSELTASDKLREFRSERPHYLDISFETIAAYRENAAMMHYSATPESFAVLRDEGFLLVDCGGHYLEGSTDITRTIRLGKLTEEEIDMYTLVLRSHLRLQSAKFLRGCTGQSLDILARGPLWDRGLDYRCGTGHGVGYLLNIHEGPNGFRYKRVPERDDGALLEPGMVTTDEPGVYVEGKYGIRTENELLLVKDEENEYGTFYSFEPITYCPYDLSAVRLSDLTAEEIGKLNQYHRMVYETLSPYLSGEEREFLKNETREVG